MNLDPSDFENWLKRQKNIVVGYTCSPEDDPLSRWVRSQYPGCTCSVDGDRIVIDGTEAVLPPVLAAVVDDLDSYGNGECKPVVRDLALQMLRDAKSEAGYL